MNFRDIEARVMASQPDYPPSQSEGGINAFYFKCETAEYSPGYAVCLAKIGHYEREGHLKMYPVCEKAISFGESSCPAIGMRAKERDAGKAMFFLDREVYQKACNEVWEGEKAAMNPQKPIQRRAMPPVTFREPRKPIVPHKPPVEAKKFEPKPAEPKVFQVPSYADAINKAIRESEQPTPPSSFVPKLASESMAEYAARVRSL